MAKKDYSALADAIIEKVGGKANISYLTHCATRLRLNVKDRALVNVEALQSVSGVLGTQWSGDQFQIIIGSYVSELYKDICDKAGIQAQASIDENLDPNLKKNKFTFYSVIEIISNALIPSLTMMIGAGMVKVLLIFLDLFKILPTDSSTYQLLFNAADAIYYFLPILVGYGVAKKMGRDPILGIVMGMFLVAPTFLANINGGIPMDFLGISIYPKAYNGTFLPAVLSTAIMCPIYTFFEKRIPKIVRNLLAPLCTFLIMIPLSYLVLAPIASIVGDYLAVGVMWVYNHTGFLGVAIFCALLPFLITTGMHYCFSPYWVAMVTTASGEPFYLISNCIFNINVGIACIVMGFKTKIVENKALFTSAGVSSAVGGISEPALFGALLKNKGALIAVIIGDFIGGAAAGLLGVAAYMWPPSWGVFMIPSFINSGAGLINAVIAVVLGFIVTAVGTFILYKDPKTAA